MADIGIRNISNITNISINVNTQVRAQGGQNGKQNGQKSGQTDRKPIDRTNEVLIDNSTTFNGLLEILRKRPEAVAAEKSEIEEKLREAKEEKLRKLYGEDYELVCGDSAGFGDTVATVLTKEKRRPGAAQLRKFEPRIAMMKIGSNGTCEVYANGYAVYDNGDRKTVLWVPDCGSAKYYFTPLKDSEKEYLKQNDYVGEDVFGELPWYMALTVAGEDSIEYNLVHPKSKGSASDADDPAEWEGLPDWRYVGGTRFPDPEEYVIEKENEAERRQEHMDALTKRQQDIYEMYFEVGKTRHEIADELGISQRAVGRIIERIVLRLKSE